MPMSSTDDLTQVRQNKTPDLDPDFLTGWNKKHANYTECNM